MLRFSTVSFLFNFGSFYFTIIVCQDFMQVTARPNN